MDATTLKLGLDIERKYGGLSRMEPSVLKKKKRN